MRRAPRLLTPPVAVAAQALAHEHGNGNGNGNGNGAGAVHANGNGNGNGNGAHAAPVVQALIEAQVARESENRGNETVEGAADVMQQFQGLMGRFLDTQRKVMLAYLQGAQPAVGVEALAQAAATAPMPAHPVAVPPPVAVPV